SHTSIKGVYGKVFPHLDALVEIFAEDKENGNGAASLAEELEEIDKEDEEEREKQTEQETKQETEQETEQEQSNETNSGNGKGMRKRVRSSSLDTGSGESSGDSNGLSLMANSFSKFVSGTLQHFEVVRSSLAQESDTSKRLFEELHKIDGLTDDDVIDATSIILDSVTKTKMFFGMEEGSLCEE
ncbi:hypothetical protein MKW98_026516, partial [Papaver atlanticum]